MAISVKALEQKVLTLAQAGRWPDVLRAGESVPERGRSAGVLHLMGLALIETGKLEEGIPLLRRAVALQPKEKAFRDNLALAIRKRDDAARARLLAGRFGVHQREVERLRASRHMDFPSHVHFETFARCNARCGFCPSSSLERTGTRMSDEMIDKIITDLEDIPKDTAFQLSPLKVNEPFLDKRMFDILADCNRRLPNAALALTTNAAPLTADNLKRLVAVRKVKYLCISVNAHGAEDYERLMGIPFARTLERLAAIHVAKRSGALTCPVVLTRVGDGSADDRAFGEWVTREYPAFQVGVIRRGGWISHLETPADDVPDVGCGRWFDISITATGVVAHCCMDGKAEHPIGDVRRQHVLDIYNAPAYRALRESQVSRLGVSPCNGCGFL